MPELRDIDFPLLSIPRGLNIRILAPWGGKVRFQLVTEHGDHATVWWKKDGSWRIKTRRPTGLGLITDTIPQPIAPNKVIGMAKSRLFALEVARLKNE